MGATSARPDGPVWWRLMARLVALAREDDFEGWRAAARTLARAGVPADQVVWQVGTQATDLLAGDPVVADEGISFPVPRAFVALAGRAILHRDPQRFGLLYAALLRVVQNPRVMDDRADPLLRRIGDLQRATGREIHKMHAFVRFREVGAGESRRFVAWFEPEHHSLMAGARFFADRFPNMLWSILTPGGSVHWDGTALTEGPAAQRHDAPAGDGMEDLWASYYAAIFNPARLMTRAMKKEMPKKYWRNMPETALVPGLVADARRRETAMLEAMPRDAPRGRVRVPVVRDELGQLQAEAAGCRRCGLCRDGGGAFGAGPRDAAMMIVGDRPGSTAATLMRQAMAAVGLEDGAVYVTYAVKHAASGLVAAEIEACRWWLEQERAMVRPRAVIAVGGVAARALAGHEMRAGYDTPVVLGCGTPCWVIAGRDDLARIEGDLRCVMSQIVQMGPR